MMEDFERVLNLTERAVIVLGILYTMLGTSKMRTEVKVLIAALMALRGIATPIVDDQSAISEAPDNDNKA